MSYGIALRNEYSENLVDVTAGLTYYKKSKGTSVLTGAAPSFSTMPWTTVAFTNNGVMPTVLSNSYNPLSLVQSNISFASTSWGSIVATNTQSGVSTPNRTYYYANPISTNKDDLVFFEMPPEGIIGLMHLWWPFTGSDINGNTISVGLTAMCCPSKNWSGSTGINYQVVSTDLPAQTSNYGLRVLDTDGTTILFDTSREVASFGDHFSITAAQVSSIINNNTSVTITLRKNIPAAWISCEGGGGSSYKVVFTSSGVTTYVLKIRQTAANKITISRETLAGTSFSWAPVTHSNYEDATFIVASF